MAVRDYSGFQAIVNSVEKLRETVDREADKQLTIFRVIRDDQRLQLTALERMVEGLKSRSQTRNNFGFPDRLELKNIKLKTRFVTLSARSVIVETKGGLSREKQSKTDSQELAKALGSEIKKIKVGGGLGNPLQILGAGILLQFGFQIAKGFEQSFGKKTGFTFKSAGQATGEVISTPVKALQSLQLPEKIKESTDYLSKKVRSVRYLVGEAIVTAIETEGDFTKKASAFGETLQAEGKRFSNNLNDDLQTAADNFVQTLQTIPSVLTSPIDNLLRTLRNEALEDIGTDLVKKQAEKIAKENKKRSSVRAIDKNTEELIITVGGYAGARGLSGLRIPDILLQQTEDNVAAIGVKNVSSDISKEVLENRYKRMEASLVSLAKPNIRGYSPDAIEMAAQALAALEKNPTIKIKLVGESGGGFVAEEATALLNLLGYKDRVEGVGIGTPDAIGGLGLKNFKKIISPDEPLGAVTQQLQKFGLTKKTSDQKILGATQHPIEGYINLPEVRQNLFGDSKTTAGESRKVLEFVEFNVKMAKQAINESGKLYYKNQFSDNLKEVQDRIKDATGKTVLKNLRQSEELLQTAIANITEELKEFAKKTEEIKVEQETRPNNQLDQVSTKQDIVETPDKVQQETKPNEPNQVPIKQDTPGRPDGSGNQPPDRSPDIVPVGPVELSPSASNNVDTQADLPRGGGLAPLAGQLDTYQKTLRESLARVLEAQKAQTEIEIEPGFWVDVEQLNQGFVKRTQTRLILFWEKLRTNLGKEINRTLASLLGTIPGAMLGRGLTGDPVGGYLGGMAGRLIAETGFQDVSNFRSLQQQGMSPATAEFWQKFGNNRKFLPNTLRKTAVGYVTGSVVGRGINDVMEVTGANQLIGALMPSWLETAIGDGINRTIKTIADPNIDLAIPNLPPAANKILSAPLHAVGKSVAAQGFLGNMGLSFLDAQTKTALMPVREALTGVGQALGGENLLGEYLGDRFTGLGIGAIQNTAKASGRGVAGMIAPGLPAEVRNFIADQVIKQGVLDGTIRDQVAPFLASRAGTDLFARGVKVPVTGRVAGTINQTLDKYDPFAIAPKQSLTDEQILLNRQQRLAKKRTTAINAVENLFNRIDKSVDETTKAVVGIGNGFLGFFDNIRIKTYDFAKKTAGLIDNPVTLIDQYVVYLDQLVQDAQKQAEETVKGIIPDYKNLTIPERKEAIGSYKADVIKQIKEFRKAIKEGDSQLALEIGENVLTIIESTRKIYKDLLEAVPSDLSGTKSIEANQRYLTSIQTEVLKGQPNIKGRAKTGLMQLVGTETSEGFIKGIEERLNKVRNSGEELAESAIEGAKKRLEIQSPSKKFRRMAQQSVAGFVQGLGEGEEEVKEAIGSFWDSLENIPILGWLVKAGRLIAKLIGDMFGSKKPSNQPKKQEPKELIDNSLYAKYVAYLDSLKTSSKQHTLKHIQSSQQYKEFKGLNREDQLKVTQQSFGEIKEQVKEFKEAIADGNKDLAFEVGETIVGATETLKLIYDDLIQEIEPDSDLAKQLEKEKKAVEKIQRQTIGNKRTKTGLTNLAREADRALEMGESVGDGFVQGIESKIGEAGIAAETLSEQVIKEAEKRLGIASPSRVFEQIGQRVVEGFNLGVKAIQSAINTPIDQALTAVDNSFSAFIANAQQGFNDFVAQIEQDFPIFAELKDLILGLAAGFALNNIFELLVGQITALGDASFDAVLELESMRLALTSVTGSAEAGAKGLAFVREEAQRLGIELKTAEEAYTGFLAVTKYTVLQGKQADRIFSVFQETAARRGLSNEEQGRMFAAINQAISKRKLSAEEVRGQLGEIPGLAFESTVARSMGVNPAQLSEMMGDGLLMAEDVFPKVAALYEAENAKIAGGTETTTQALTRFQNAIVNLQRSFEGWIAPAKTFFNFFAAAIEKISEIIPIVVRYLGIFSAALLIDFAKISIGLAKFLGGLKSVQAVLSVLARIAVAAFKLIYKELLIFLGQFALLTLAFDAVGAAIYVLSNNAFPELKKDIEEATKQADQLEQALQNVGKATQAIPKELPKTEEEIVTNRNWNILGWDTGFNLEGTRQFLNNIDKALGFEPMLTTLGQQEFSNFQENVEGLLSEVNRDLAKQFDVEKTIKEIRELDKELTKARSRQFNIPAGDKKRYEAAIKEQQKLIEERDKRLDVTANFETGLQNSKARIEKQLKALNELVARRGITEDAEKSIRAQLEQRLKDIDKTSTAFDDLMSNLQKSVNALTLALRNLNEQASYFNETLQRNATNARVQFMRRARAAGLGSQARDLGLEEIEQNTLEARIVFLRDQLGAVNEYLSKPDFADVLTELRQQAEDMGVNLENTATIDRLISENRSQQETAVLNTLKEQLRLQDELGQAEENLEQSISSTRSAITDLNNSVEEFFFNLTQRIDEAIVEVDRILNRLKYTDIKNRLQRALVPGSNTFVNGLVNQIQGIFDRASGIVEQLLGQRSARINFVGERRGLQVELENFTRNLGGATEALELFRQGLLGSQPSGGVGQPSGGVGQPSASGRFSLGKIGETGIGTGSHLDIRGRDAKGNIMSEARLREFFSQVYVDGKPLSEQLNKITSGYGIRRPPTRGASREHYAFDFGFPKGTPLEFRGAASSARSYFTRGNGNTVELTLPTGEKLLFLHLDSVANLGTIQRGRVNIPGNTTGNTPGNTPRRGMPNVPFASLIEGAARQYGLDPLLFAALIKKESGFRQEKSPGQIVTSPVGALGISQLMPGTAKELGVDPRNVTQNLIGGAKYLARMLERFGGNIELALSAYKAGPGNVRNNQLARGTVRDVGMVMQYYREFQQQMAKSASQVATAIANQPAALAIPKQIQSVLVQEVGGKTVFSKNASTPPASPASTIKLIVADILSKEIKKGTIGLKDQITIKQPLVDPHGTLKSGNRRTVQELIDLMLRVSDNTATNVLIDLMGGLQSVTNKAQQSGYTATTLSRYLNIPGSGPANRSNAVDTTRAMQAILSDNSEAGQLAEKSIRQTRNFKFSGELGGKIGNNSKVIGNVGIVSINGKEYIVTAYANVNGNVLSNRGIITNATNLITSSLSASPTPSDAPTPPTAPIPNVNNAAAEGLTNRLIKIKENQINLGDAGVRQEIEEFFIELQQTQQEILRQMGDSIRQSTQSVIDAQNSLQDIRSQYKPQTQSAQLETELRGVENQFRGLDTQLFEQERGLTDNIQGLDNLLGQMKPILEILHASTNQVDKESASFLMGLIGRIEQDKATYSGMRTEIQQLRGQLKEGKLDAENFVKAQAKLRTIQADLERIGTELSIAQEQNNLEQERAIALLQSRQQLELDLLQIAQDFEDEDRDKRLALAKEQARLREREIEYQFQSKTLSQETELISQRLAIAQSLSNLGKINKLELLQSQKQLEQEILEIKKQYPNLADQELRINLAKEQARLREIEIENNYNNQRWQRQQELFDMESRIVEARAARLERSGQPFEAAAMREELGFRAELLRYEQEIEAIRQRYTDPADEQTRDELIRNAGILLELNLEQIDQQFKDLGETIRDTASGAFATFLEDTLTGTKTIGNAFLDMAQSILKSLAQIAARMAIGGLFRLFKIPIPGFADGGTVPNFAEGDTVKSAKVANLPFKGIQEALRKEGPQGVLAVFSPGEEILGLRTGEAQRYQRLKAQLGKNPLAKIGNFADGGTIGINESLLAGLNYGMPTAGRLPNNFGQTTQVSNYGGDRSVTVNVTAPNPSAFNASERQIGRTIAEYLSRV